MQAFTEKPVMSIDETKWSFILLCFQQGPQIAFEGQISFNITRDMTPIWGEGVTFCAENIWWCVIYHLIVYLIN